jgi:hypothetical protein
MAAFFAGLFGHVAPVCVHTPVNAPVAIHFTQNAGFEMNPAVDPKVAGSLFGQAPLAGC